MKVMMVGSARQSSGGVASVIRTMERMPLWSEFDCYWLGTQIQRNYLWKVWYALKAYFIALCIIWRYDIIHFHTVPDNVCLAIQLPIFLLARLGRKKVILHLHVGNQLEEHTQHKFFVWYLGKANSVVVLSDKWKNLLKEKYPSVKVPVHVIYNASEDVDSISYERHKHTLLFAGALRPNKSCHLILEAYAKIKDSYPDWHIDVLGSGIEEAHLKHLARELNIDDSVNFTGQLPREITKEYFQRAGIYCMCSKVEGFPMVVLEAWAYGVPVVATPVGGLPDVAVEGKNMCTFPFDDVKTLSQRLSELMGNEEKRKEMSLYSRDFFRKHFSLSPINKSIVQLYKSLV